MAYYPEIKERIAQLAAELKVDKAGLGRLAGVSKVAAGKWFAGTACPERDALVSMKRKARVSDEWLLHGKGAMFIGSYKINEERPDYFSDANTIRMLEAWRQLPPDMQMHYIALMEYSPEPSANVINNLPTRGRGKKKTA